MEVPIGPRRTSYAQHQKFGILDEQAWLSSLGGPSSSSPCNLETWPVSVSHRFIDSFQELVITLCEALWSECKSGTEPTRMKKRSLAKAKVDDRQFGLGRVCSRGLLPQGRQDVERWSANRPLREWMFRHRRTGGTRPGFAPGYPEYRGSDQPRFFQKWKFV
jgi:hypothetical protein